MIFVLQVQQASAQKEQEMSDHMETLKVCEKREIYYTMGNIILLAQQKRLFMYPSMHTYALYTHSY